MHFPKKDLMLRRIVFGTFLAGTFPGKPGAAETLFNFEPMHATVNWEIGEIENYTPDFHNGEVGAPKQIIDQTEAWLLEKATLSDNIKIFLGVGGEYFFFPIGNSTNYAVGQKSAFDISDAHGEIELWRNNRSEDVLLLKAGVFPFKYDEDAKNLGEYLFRTYTYPNAIYTGGLTLINSAGAQLNGLDANTRVGGLKNDILLTVQTEQIPTRSLSMTELASYTYHHFLTVGAGIMLDNFYDPTGVANGDRALPPPYTDYYVLKDGTVVNGAGNIPSGAIVTDSGNYTFKGQKVMFHASMDFGKLLDGPLFPGRDLTLYSEGIVMGLKDYPGYYDDFWHRTVLMAGIDLPTFGVLNVLSVEGEYYTNPYPNDVFNAEESLAPVPFVNGYNLVVGNKFKWTVYASKTVLKCLTITGQVANDHMREIDYFGTLTSDEIMPQRDDWYWAFQFSYSN